MIMTTRFVPTTTRSARDIVETDQEWTVDERDAFASFTERINGLDVDMVDPSTDEFQQSSRQLLVAQPHASNTASLEEIRDIYRETVMGIDHYTDVYGDTLEESLAQEFGPEVATTATTSDQLTPQLRDRIVNCSQQARKSRQSLLQGLKKRIHGSQDCRRKADALGI